MKKIQMNDRTILVSLLSLLLSSCLKENAIPISSSFLYGGGGGQDRACHH